MSNTTSTLDAIPVAEQPVAAEQKFLLRVVGMVAIAHLLNDSIQAVVGGLECKMNYPPIEISD